MASALRPFAASTLALTLALFVGALAPACKAQAEGERCDKDKTKDADCEPPLVCIGQERLAVGGTDRCCPSVSGEESDSRCRRKVSTGDTGDAGASAGGDSGTGGTSTGGTSTGGTSTGGTGTGGTGTGGVPAGEGGMSGSPDLGEAGATASIAGQGGAP